MDTQEKKTILLVEDEQIIAITNAHEIKRFGYEVEIANSGDEAIKIALSNVNINLILMDIDLGIGIDGTEAAEIILKDRDIPIVFLSSHTESEIVEKTEKITSYGYVTKNSNMTVISASIKMAFKLFEANQKIINEITERKRAEDTLRTSEESLATTLHSIGDAVIAADVYGRVTRMNTTAERLTGWCFSDAEHQPLLSVFNIANSITGKQVINPVEKVLTTGQIVGLANHTVLISRDGSKYQISDSAAPILDKQGRVSGVILVFSDITEKYEVEEKLRQSEEKFRSLVETAQELVWKCDANGRFTYLNPAWEKTHGYRVEEMLGRSFSEFQRPEVFARDIVEFSKHLAGGFVRGYETSHIAKNGNELTLLFNAIPLFAVDGTIVGTQGTAIDITESKQAKSIFFSIIDKNPMSIQIVDKEGFTIRVNAAHTALFGAIPPSNYSIFHDMQINQQGLGELMDRVKNGEVVHFPDFHYNAHDLVPEFPDKPIWIRMVIFSLVDSNGKPERFVLMHEDITNRKLAEEKINTLLAEKELILKEVHHRIKNNMNVISSLLSLQAGDSSEKSVITALDDAKSRVQSMMLLYDKLYLSSSFETISLVEYLPALFKQIIRNFPNSAIVKIETQIDDFTLDSKKMSSLGIIINELLTNTMKYAFIGRREGLILVEAKLITNLETNENIVSLSIQDNGNGIPESIDFENSIGFGLRLIEILTKQLKGNIKIYRENGTKVTLKFEK